MSRGRRAEGPLANDPMALAQDRRLLLEHISWLYGFTQGYLHALGVPKSTNDVLQKQIKHCKPLDERQVREGEKLARDHANAYARSVDLRDSHELRRVIRDEPEPDLVVSPAAIDTIASALIGAEPPVTPQPAGIFFPQCTHTPDGHDGMCSDCRVSRHFNPTFTAPPEPPDDTD